MARIRSVKPDFWTSAQILECSTNARLLFIGIWNFADDTGRHPDSSKQIKAEIFPSDPFTDEQVFGWINELKEQGLIIPYAIDGVKYFYVKGWKHQKIDRPQPSKYPAPIVDDSTNIQRTFVPDKIGKDKIGKDIDAAPQQARVLDDEADLFRRGKEVLGNSSGGLIKKLLTAKKGKVPLARAAIEASTEKENPREYIGGIIKKRDGPDDLRERGEAW